MKQPKLIKSSSEIKFPESELESTQEKEIQKVLYKSFVINLEESVLSKNK